jgi:hypothetical protein
MEYVRKGEMKLLSDRQLTLKLETCCGTILYDKRGNVGVAHSVIPEQYRDIYHTSYRLLDEEFNPDLVTRTAVTDLVNLLRTKSDAPLYSIICGCMRSDMDFGLGVLNQHEAAMSLIAQGIPISHYLTQLPYRSDVDLDARSMDVELFGKEGLVRRLSIAF